MAITYYSANRILDYNFGRTTYTVPANLYIGLSTSSINIDGTGATEPVGNAYDRVSVANNKTNFGVAANGTITNLTTITFSESTASWGTITHIGLWDAATGGNLWYFEALPTPRIVQSQTTVLFLPGSITITMNNT